VLPGIDDDKRKQSSSLRASNKTIFDSYYYVTGNIFDFYRS